MEDFWEFLESISMSSIYDAFSNVLLHLTSLIREIFTAPTMCQTLFKDRVSPLSHRIPLSSSCSCSNKTMSQLSQPCHDVPLCSSLFPWHTPSWHVSSLALSWMT